MMQKLLNPIRRLRSLFQGKQNTIDYVQMMKHLQQQDLQEDQKLQLLEHLKQVQDEAFRQINASYDNTLIHTYLSSIPSKKLCFLAVEQFIGSRTSPKNLKTTQLFLSLARQNAKSEAEILDVDFYEQYLEKIEAQSKDDELRVYAAQDKIVGLSQKMHGVALHLLGKELFFHGKELQGSEAQQIYQESFRYFEQAAKGKSLHSFFYLGQMAEQGKLTGEPDPRYAYECYLIAASQDSPKAYFQLAKCHQQGVGVPQDDFLYVHYTRKAAELGLLESQHNLGCLYLEGQLVPKDEEKAMAWFLHAGGHGFSISLANAAGLFESGSENFKQNLEKALELLNKIKDIGDLDVKASIQRVEDKMGKQ